MVRGMESTARAPGAVLKLVVLLASVRQGRFGPTVARWFLSEARGHDSFDVDLIDLAETPLPSALPSNAAELMNVASRPPEMVSVAARLAAADAFVVVTPEYNHSFPASLKHFIDWHFTEWQAKPVSFVSYGAAGRGLRAVEHLRLVFAELHAVAIRDTVSFERHSELFNGDGQLASPEGPRDAARVLLEQLAWWGRALREARRETPYRPAK